MDITEGFGEVGLEAPQDHLIDDQLLAVGEVSKPRVKESDVPRAQAVFRGIPLVSGKFSPLDGAANQTEYAREFSIFRKEVLAE